jgi:hypothetical protein
VIPEDAGAVKIDILFFDPTEWGSSAGVSMLEFVNNLYSNDTETQLISTKELQVNGQPALLVTTESTFGQGQFYLFKHSDELFVGFGPGGSTDNADTQNILNSLAITPEVTVSLPNELPGPPPVGLAAECIPGYEVAIEPTVEIPEINTACGLQSFKSLDYLVESVQQRLQERNTGGLRWEYFINDPMTLGYWASEGLVLSPDEFATTLANSLYDPGEPGGMTFTSNREEFPPLAGIPPETMFGPDVNIAQIVYSEGWGTDGQGAALLFFAQDDCDGFYWSGMVFSPTHFDK